MRIKSILENINEKYETSFKDRFDKYHEIFINPSKKELRELSLKSRGKIRFIADKGMKKVFISDAEILHEDIQKNIDGFSEHYFYLLSRDRFSKLYY